MQNQMIYGTAWKEERTEELVLQALECGFKRIDTANQRKHYFEEGVGRALSKWLSQSQNKGTQDKGLPKREDLFIQTKYTYERGQDHRLPYDPKARFATQVEQSVQSSLKHLGISYIDSLVLHGPYGARTLHEIDLEVWGSMENLVRQGTVLSLGISNVTTFQLEELFKKVNIKPSHVQNRCFAATGFDQNTRLFCAKNQIAYQGFSLLTANARELASHTVQTMVRKYNKSASDLVFRFCAQVGITPIVGSSSKQHLNDDLIAFESNDATFRLTEEEVLTIERLGLQAH